MLIQEEEGEEGREGKARPCGGRRRIGRGVDGAQARAKDRSALRRFSPRVVKRGYKAQRDGLGESCARCVPARLFVLLFALLFFSSFSFSFLFFVFFSVSLLLLHLEEWLDCFRCANLTMQRGLAFLPSQVRRARGGERRNPRSLSIRALLVGRRPRGFHTRSRECIAPMGRGVEIDSETFAIAQTLFFVRFSSRFGRMSPFEGDDLTC